MLTRPLLALAATQFAAACAVVTVMLFGTDPGVRSVLMANLAACTALFALTGGAAWSGRIQVNRRLRRAWPTATLLLVPGAFTGWAAEQAHPLAAWPDILAVLECTLPFTVLLALQTAVFVPAVSPPASESPASARHSARAFTYLVLALVAGVVGIALGTRFALLPLEDSFRGDLALVLPLFAAGYALNAVHVALAPALNLGTRPALTAQLGVAAAALNLVLNLALVPPLGLLGAALSTCVTFLALALATFYTAQRHSPLPYEYARLAKIGAAAAIVLLAALRWPLSHDWAIIAGYALAAAAGFVVVLALSGFLQPSERAALRRAISIA